jgi:AraC-like DNA-binding protein
MERLSTDAVLLTVRDLARFGTNVSTQQTTIASTANLLAHTLRRYGCDVEAIFAEAGLNPNPERAASLRYPVDKMQIVWRLAVERTGDDCFGLAVAEGVVPQAMHGLGFAWLTSDTLYDAFNRVVRYQRLISTLADFSLHRIDDCMELRISTRGNPDLVHPATIDAALGVFLRMSRLALGEPVNPCCVNLRRSRPGCAERFLEFFRAPIAYEAETDGLIFDLNTLHKPLPNANPELARANDQVVIDYLARFDQESVSMRVRAQLIDLLPAGRITLKDVANSLGMSARNLQRKLAGEGCPFRELLDETRRDLALHYMHDKYRSIGEITYLLGFAEPSNFTRAFRRWTGTSPKQYREERVS